MTLGSLGTSLGSSVSPEKFFVLHGYDSIHCAAKSCTTTAYRRLFRDSPPSLRTLWSAVVKSPKCSALGTTFLVLVIFVWVFGNCWSMRRVFLVLPHSHSLLYWCWMLRENHAVLRWRQRWCWWRWNRGTRRQAQGQRRVRSSSYCNRSLCNL